MNHIILRLSESVIETALEALHDFRCWYEKPQLDGDSQKLSDNDEAIDQIRKGIS